MNPSVVACGRCGASNPEDADFCQSCGALLAAYRAPAGATDTIAALTQPAESTPVSELSYIPLARLPEPAPVIVVEEPPRLDEALHTRLVEEPPPEVQIEGVKAISEPVLIEEVTPAATSSSLKTQPATQPAPNPRNLTVAPPSSPPQAVPEAKSPIPAVYKAVFGKYAEIAYPAERLPGTGRSSPSPHTIVLIGVAALIGVCIAAMVASSNAAVLLLIGGPVAFSLIAIGALMLVGRYPTGRP